MYESYLLWSTLLNILFFNDMHKNQLSSATAYCHHVVENISVRQRWYLIILRLVWSKRWGSLGKCVDHWGSYGLKQSNTFQNFKVHSQLYNIFILLSFFGSIYHHFKVHRFDIWLYWDFFGVKGEVLCKNCWPLRQLRPETGEYLAKF